MGKSIPHTETWQFAFLEMHNNHKFAGYKFNYKLEEHPSVLTASKAWIEFEYSTRFHPQSIVNRTSLIFKHCGSKQINKMRSKCMSRTIKITVGFCLPQNHVIAASPFKWVHLPKPYQVPKIPKFWHIKVSLESRITNHKTDRDVIISLWYLVWMDKKHKSMRLLQLSLIPWTSISAAPSLPITRSLWDRAAPVKHRFPQGTLLLQLLSAAFQSLRLLHVRLTY
jgi:hypothetical protein